MSLLVSIVDRILPLGSYKDPFVDDLLYNLTKVFPYNADEISNEEFLSTIKVSENRGLAVLIDASKIKGLSESRIYIGTLKPGEGGVIPEYNFKIVGYYHFKPNNRRDSRKIYISLADWLLEDIDHPEATFLIFGQNYDSLRKQIDSFISKYYINLLNAELILYDLPRF